MMLSHATVASWYVRYGGGVLRRARTVLGSEALAQEARQEIFARLLHAQPTFKTDCTPSTWLYRVTTCHCIDLLRRQNLERRLAVTMHDDSESLREAAGGVSEATVLLRQVLRQADSLEAAAAIYVYIDQMTYDEAAPLLGVSRRTVGNLVTRFRNKARRLAMVGAAVMVAMWITIPAALHEQSKGAAGLRIVSLYQGKQVSLLDGDVVAPGARLRFVVDAPDNVYVAVFGRDARGSIWQGTQGATMQKLAGGRNQVLPGAVAPDHEGTYEDVFFFACTQSQPMTRLREVVTGTQGARLPPTCLTRQLRLRKS